MISESYRKQWSDMSGACTSAIRDHRQEDAVLRIIDASGKPIPQAQVRIVQKQHDFAFGCNCLWLGQLGSANKLYENKLAELFNLVTTTFCLSDIQPEPGRWRFAEGSGEIFRRPPPDRVVTFGKKHNLWLKGQPLLAGSWFPKWASDFSHDQIRALYEDYFRRVAERYSHSFDIFDLVNESLCHTKFPLYNDNLDYVEWAFKCARPLFPSRVRLELNEATPHIFNTDPKSGNNRFFNLVQRLLDKSTPIDAIGMQFHLWSPAIDAHLQGIGPHRPEKVHATIEAFATLGLPIYISEITLPSTMAPAPDGEDLQADILRNFYQLFFSIKRVNGIIYWNLCDGTAWRNEGNCKAGLTDEYFREKPAYQALEQLICRQWLTACTLQADDQGVVSFRGFRGSYEAQVNNQEFTFTLHNKQTINTLQLA
ncbi:MAG: endo-1,4-beta-xylanase [Lentisphaeria bacterium]|jgi:endo-1,4-beta-xylanase